MNLHPSLLQAEGLGATGCTTVAARGFDGTCTTASYEICRLADAAAMRHCG
jgi:hypothetical protein